LEILGISWIECAKTINSRPQPTGVPMNILRSAIHCHLFPFIVGEPVVDYRKEYCPPRHRWASFEGFSVSMMALPWPALFLTLRLGSSHPRSIKGVPPPSWGSPPHHRRTLFLVVTASNNVHGLGYDSAWFRSLTSSRRFHCWACHVIAVVAMMPPDLRYRCGARRLEVLVSWC